MTSPDTLAASASRPKLQKGGPSIESVLQNPWARLAVPSLSDLFFAAVLVWVCLSGGAAGWEALLADGDAGWHIRTGEWILNHHAVPHQDLYSFSKAGEPWYAWEWLTDVIDASLHRAFISQGGLKGVVLLTGLVIATFATTILRRMIAQGVHLLWALVVALLAVGASSIHFLARPHMFTLLFLSLSMWMIEKDRNSPSPKSAQRLWWLVPLTILWTNMHGGFLALIAVLGLTAAGYAVEAWLGRGDYRDAIRYVLLAAACGAASFINPYGYQLHVHVVQYLRSDWIRSVIQEFQSPSFRTENMMQFEVLLLVGVIAAGALLKRRRIAEALWILYFAHMALSSVRHVPIYATVVAPVIAGEISRWWMEWTGAARKSSLLGIVNQMAADSAAGFRRSSALPALIALTLVVLGPPVKWPKDFPERMFPAKIVDEHSSEILHARALTTDQWADYLIYKNPGQKVFVDGRSDFYGPEIGNQYIHVTNGQPDWDQVMTKYNFDLVLLPVELPLVQLLKLDRGWRVEADDGKRILLVRKSDLVPLTSNLGKEPRF